MQFLKIKRRASGSRNEMYFVTSRGKMDKGRKERYISKRKNYLITGDADSGKTRILKRIYDEKETLYKGKKVYIFYAIDPIAQWLGGEIGNQREKLDLLLERLRLENSLVLFDDLHKLSGRKLQIAKAILQAAKNYWISAITANRLPPTLRRFADDSKVEHIELDTSVAFDGTVGVVIFLILIGVMAGHPELAIMAGIGGLLANGRLGSSNKS